MITKLLFFPEFDLNSGYGHLNRLLAFAEQLNDIYKIEFVFTHKAPINFQFSYFTLNESNSTIEEINNLSQKIDYQQTALVLDGYHFNQDYQKKLKHKLNKLKLIYVDDLAGKQNYADIIINHAPGAKSTHYQISNQSTLLLGIKYLMIRKEFLNQNENVTKSVEGSIFICFGGIDKENWTKYFVNQLAKVDKIKKINVVLGEGYKHSLSWLKNDKVRSYQELSPLEIKKEMQKSKLLIISSSTISLEALTLNKKFVSVKTAANQKYIFQGLNDYSQVYPIDINEKINPQEVKKWIINQLYNCDLNYKKKNLSSMLSAVIPKLL